MMKKTRPGPWVLECRVDQEDSSGGSHIDKGQEGDEEWILDKDSFL